MTSPHAGTYLASALLAAAGGWAVSQAVTADDRPAVVAAAPTQQPLTVRIVTDAPPPQPAAPERANDLQDAGTAATSVAPTTQRAPARTVPASGVRPQRAVPQRRREARGGERGSDVARLLLLPTQTPRRPATQDQPAVGEVTTQVIGSGNVLASDGAIVYIGSDGHLVANTGHTSTSGVVALGVSGSELVSGDSRTPTAPAPTAPAPTAPAPASPRGPGAGHVNGSWNLLAGGSPASVAISGFEDHSVSVLGNDQVTTYDDSNVFLGRDGTINANTGDTDSSGLNAVDVRDSVVHAGNSGDGEESSDDEADEADEAGEAAGSGTAAGEGGAGPNDETDDEERSAPQPGTAAGPAASVTDEGASTATGTRSLVVGADGYDDVSIRAQGDRNVTTYDDSNVVIGGSGHVNAQIGDSDTGGAVVMGIHRVRRPRRLRG